MWFGACTWGILIVSLWLINSFDGPGKMLVKLDRKEDSGKMTEVEALEFSLPSATRIELVGSVCCGCGRNLESVEC